MDPASLSRLLFVDLPFKARGWVPVCLSTIAGLSLAIIGAGSNIGTFKEANY